MNRRWFSVGFVLPMVGMILLGWAQSSVAQEAKKTDAKPAEGKNIVDTAAAAPDCKTLCELLKTAGLVDTLKGKGPFTVFAPDDAAFEKLGKATLDDLKKPANKDKLVNILKYHVVAGKHLAADVGKMKTSKMLNGKETTITTKDNSVMIDNAKITKTDVACSNGVIHMINTVLMPKDNDKHEEKKGGQN